jgi:hypothetical protein
MSKPPKPRKVARDRELYKLPCAACDFVATAISFSGAEGALLEHVGVHPFEHARKPLKGESDDGSLDVSGGDTRGGPQV